MARLEAFLPRVREYARRRNFDFGPGRHDAVSRLSPYVRHRLVTEEEVACAVLGRTTYGQAEKFLQEIAWRTYWKGWLEMRPEVWHRYVREVEALRPGAECDAAMAGNTGIACFDAWAHELVETGYLHNHARMWFASIWIFTLRLPWQLGADFFLRHLLDGDPAANTLSWRWVAGLHTRGKHYLARASNIATFTDGRFDPGGRLDEEAQPLEEDGEIPAGALDFPCEGTPAGRIGHWMMADDLGPPPCEVVASGGWHPDDPGCLWPVVSPLVHEARRSAVDDAVARAGGERFGGDLAEALASWIGRHRLDGVVVACPTVGPWRQAFDGAAAGLPVHRFVRGWDRSLWPHASGGYFRMKKRLPGFFRELASGGGQRWLL